VQQALSPGGAEVVVHAVRAYIEEHKDNTDVVMLLLDFVNAFNEISRKHFLQAMIKEIPEIGPYLYAEYRCPKKVVYPEGVEVAATQGLIQGDSLGPANCCAAEKILLKDIKGLLGEGDFLAALMDDITVIAPQETAVKVVKFVLEVGPQYGFKLNLPKTVAFPICLVNGTKPNPKLKSWPEGIAFIQGEGLQLGGKEEGARSLGSYIGTPQYVTNEIRKRIDTKAKPLLDFAVKMRHATCAWEVIKRVPSITGLDYIFRTTPPALSAAAGDYFDALLRDAFERAVLNERTTDQQWRMAQLPFPVGWNLTPSKVKATAAYLASLHAHSDQITALNPSARTSTKELIASLEANIQAQLPADSPLKFNLRSRTRQKDITKVLLNAQAAALTAEADHRTKALINAQSDKRAAAFKATSLKPGLALEPEEFEVIARRSLGVPLVTEHFHCVGCSAVMDIHGDHECPKLGAWVKRHNVLRDLLYTTAREGLVECEREQKVHFHPECHNCLEIFENNQAQESHVCPKPNENRKPFLDNYTADLVLEHGVPGLTLKKTLVDVTIKNEFLPTYLDRSSKALGAAALCGEREKDADFKLRVEKLNRDFIALSCDSMGYVRPIGESLIYYLVQRRAVHKSMTFTDSAALFWHQWSIALHRANARNILARYRSIAHLSAPRTTYVYM
jgi:hypothetical protein